METVVAVTMVKDEADIIETTVRNMASQVDHVLVSDNGSTDDTRPILNRLVCELENLTVLDDPEPAYMQSAKMTALARMAHEGPGATWIVPFDADEIWYSSFGPIAEILEGIDPSIAVAKAELFDHVATGSDPQLGSPVERMGWRRRYSLPLPKVACRWRDDLTIHQGNHGCDYGGIAPAGAVNLVVRHFPYRSVDQLIRKVRNGAAAYRAAGDRLPADAGKHWREWGERLDSDGEQWIVDLFNVWYRVEDPFNPDANLLFDPAPTWPTPSK